MWWEWLLQAAKTCNVVAQFQEKNLLRLHTGTYVQGTEGMGVGVGPPQSTEKNPLTSFPRLCCRIH